MSNDRILPGLWYPLGATLEPGGVNFALPSAGATGVVLALYDDPHGPPTASWRLPCRTRNVWHGFIPGLAAGQLYGYRVEGPHQPAQGLRFNPNKLLLDPWARALSGPFPRVDETMLAYEPGSPLADLSFDARDSGPVMPKAVVIDDRGFDWRGDRPPRVPLRASVIYEVHLKGFTAHPSSGVSQPGTYLGFIEKIPHLRALGITAVELLPIHAHVDEGFLLARGLVDYWGYNSVGFFAPEPRYGSRRHPGCEVDEFKTLVRALHAAGIEVILDVVYNHSAEGNEFGPTLNLRGLDNPGYYQLTGPAGAPGRWYWNHSGTGNTVDAAQQPAIRLIMDSLRYWVQQMHVDGFRFDLAAALGRDGGGFARGAALFDAIAQDPVLQPVKLIAEPWDLDDCEAGNFPVDWSEWNGRFRDTVRRFVRGDAGQLGDLGRRLTGSADLYGDDGRSAWNSINFVASHDGFTLADLVAYERKHNEANGEANRDGSDDNLSSNHGAEGPSDDPAIALLRRQQQRNLLALLMLSLGTPMLLGGDEFGRSQRGNNNAYAQDNAISWFDWDQAAREPGLIRFVNRLIAFTGRCPALQRRRALFDLNGDDARTDGITWSGPDGGPPRWDDAEARTLVMALDPPEPSPVLGPYRVVVMLHAGPWLQPVRIPTAPPGLVWHRVIDTSLADGAEIADAGAEVLLADPEVYLVNPRSTVVLLARRV